MRRFKLWWFHQRRKAKLSLIDVLENQAVQAAGRRDIYAAYRRWDAEYRAYAKVAGDTVREVLKERYELVKLDERIKALEAA